MMMIDGDDGDDDDDDGYDCEDGNDFEGASQVINNCHPSFTPWFVYNFDDFERFNHSFDARTGGYFHTYFDDFERFNHSFDARTGGYFHTCFEAYFSHDRNYTLVSKCRVMEGSCFYCYGRTLFCR